MIGMALAVTGAVLLVLFGATFCVAVAAGRHSVADTAWGLGIALVGGADPIASAGHGDPTRRLVLVCCTVLWGLRLAAHVTWRNHGAGEDPRYRDLLGRARGNRNVYALRVVYLPQVLVLWLACVAIAAGMVAKPAFGVVNAAGAALWLCGFCFESAGDWQLARFKEDPANRGKLMDRGLWRYTRHPNYFGDACMWWGLFLIGLGPLWTVFSPLMMTIILTRGTGQRLTDKRLAATKPEYAQYAARTSGFVPLPPRR